MITTAALVGFACVVFVAYTTGTALGFGTSILMITFASQFVALDQLLPVIAPLNMTLGIYIVSRYRKAVLWRQLLTRIFPSVFVGVPLGMLLFELRHLGGLRAGFGVFVFILAAREIYVSTRGANRAPSPPLPRPVGFGFLAAAGVAHGLYTTGGPLVVYVLGREIDDKTAFRATISLMFLPITVGLMVNYARLGLVSTSTLTMSAAGLVPMAAGMLVGEWVHAKVDNARFKFAVWCLLFVGGAILAARAFTT